MKRILIHTDGSLSPDKIVASSFVAKTPRGERIHAWAGVFRHEGVATSNVAEYGAILHALRWAIEQHHDAKHFLYTDSQLVAYHLLGKYAVRAANLIPYYREAMTLIRQLHADVQWIPRDQNTEADQLARSVWERQPKADRRPIVPQTPLWE